MISTCPKNRKNRENRKDPRFVRFLDTEILTTIAILKVCSLLAGCFIISIGVSGDHSQLRCTGFSGSHKYVETNPNRYLLKL